jgi:hypothetical protein
MLAFFLELRVSSNTTFESGFARRAAFEEILKRNAEIANRLLRRAFGHFQHPRKLFSLNGIERTP